jgi:ubiquinol-cytochrome c reductase cytochrome c1 subunit
VKKYSVIIIFLMASSFLYGQHSDDDLIEYTGDVRNTESLQRGAKYFVNMCMGCHDLKFMRYSQVGKGLALSNEELGLLIRAGSRELDPMTNAMSDEDGLRWFGVSPPDLSLVSRSRGTEYLFNFLIGFYPDNSRPTGVNNYLLPNTSMPNVFWQLENTSHGEPDHDLSSSDELIEVATDIVNFLDYVGEPMQLERQELGKKVIGFLFLFLVIAYALKREIWKEVH